MNTLEVLPISNKQGLKTSLAIIFVIHQPPTKAGFSKGCWNDKRCDVFIEIIYFSSIAMHSFISENQAFWLFSFRV